jgi:lipoyl(octanoyl) transferase
VPKNREIEARNLGLMGYAEAWALQEQLFADTLAVKVANRALPEEEQQPTRNYLLCCEHPPVFTLGKSGSEAHLLANEAQLATRGATYYKVNRGGDITFHGPGQVVMYPILDLDNFFTDIHKYLRFLEEGVILTLAEYGLTAGRIPGLTGVWLDDQEPAKARKICAMGVKSSRWVTMHGLAFNVNTDLSFFDLIVPCGIKDKAVTSLQQELHREIPLQEVNDKLTVHLLNLFEAQPIAELNETRH